MYKETEMCIRANIRSFFSAYYIPLLRPSYFLSIRLSCYSIDKYCVLILFLQVHLRLILIGTYQKSFMFQKSRIWSMFSWFQWYVTVRQLLHLRSHFYSYPVDQSPLHNLNRWYSKHQSEISECIGQVWWNMV